jgi:hypothetical protein
LYRPLGLRPDVHAAVDTIPVTFAPYLGTTVPEIKILTEFIRMDAFAHQLSRPNDGVESVIENSYCLTDKIVPVGKLIVVQDIGCNGLKVLELRLDDLCCDPSRAMT